MIGSQYDHGTKMYNETVTMRFMAKGKYAYRQY